MKRGIIAASLLTLQINIYNGKSNMIDPTFKRNKRQVYNLWNKT